MMTLDEGGWRRSTVRIFAAPPTLRDLIELVWVDEWSDDETRSRQFRIVADDAAHLLWYLGGADGRRTERVSIVGARSRYHDADLSGRRLLIGARLLPGALPVFTRIPAFRLTDRAVPLTEVAASASRALDHLRPRTEDEGVQQLCEVLDRMRGPGRQLDPFALWIASLSRSEMPSVSEIARAFDVSARAIRSWSAATFGMGLKRLLTIRRLHAALELRLSATLGTWSQVAAAAGYADQSHLVRDCRALLGESPTTFIARGG
jgi:AraC-like DNA-binding protein